MLNKILVTAIVLSLNSLVYAGGEMGGGNGIKQNFNSLSVLFSTELDEQVTIIEKTTDQEYVVQSEETGEIFSVIYTPDNTANE